MRIKTTTIDDIRDQLSHVAYEVGRQETRFLVEDNGTPVFAIVSAEDLERLTQLEPEREERFKIIDRVREAFRDVPPEEIEHETDRIIEDFRAADRASTDTLVTSQ
jgi:prevent-host-death family protein